MKSGRKQDKKLNKELEIIKNNQINYVVEENNESSEKCKRGINSRLDQAEKIRNETDVRIFEII